VKAFSIAILLSPLARADEVITSKQFCVQTLLRLLTAVHDPEETSQVCFPCGAAIATARVARSSARLIPFTVNGGAG